MEGPLSANYGSEGGYFRLRGGPPGYSPPAPSRSSPRSTARAPQRFAVGARARPWLLMAFAAPPPKAHCFILNAPEGSTVDDVIDALEAVTGPAGIKSLQHMGGVKFSAAASSENAAMKLKSRGAILLNGESVPLVSIGPEIVHVSVFRVPLWVGDAALASALSAYGNVQQVHEPAFKGRPGVGTGIRVARVEMKKPIPNFLSVQGHTVMCDYRGVKKVCSRCRLAGHIGKDCATPRCTRCGVFGHTTDGCTEPCRRCGGNHATVDCVRPRSFAAAAAGEQEGIDSLSTPMGSHGEQAPLEEASNEAVASDAESQGDIADLPHHSGAKSTAHQTQRETEEDTSSETCGDLSSPRPGATAALPSGGHEDTSSDAGSSTGSADAPRSSMGRGTRAATRTDAPFTGLEKINSRAGGLTAQTRRMNLSNPLHKITGPVAAASSGDCAMDVERQAVKRVHPSSTDSEGVLENVTYRGRELTKYLLGTSRRFFGLADETGPAAEQPPAYYTTYRYPFSKAVID
ncbi:hypothetical protein HPB52_008119 [Rhipicephalus sanguineus]|uniref:CCHC-type domain-containing protein n=1 Tax=Rhipicephalus sanguineus TaxID=34632 RepID=A0A9D4PYN2_RHISA|nr:hypothetical protein HPB52_008119 [Rhipicephalus sanguineus]